MWADQRVPNAAGILDARFGKVGDGFGQNFAEGLELGASFAVMIDGELLIDIRGGFADRARENPWTEDTITCVFSTGKAVLSFLIAREVSAGRLDYEVPVASYWPEFAQNGKAEITLGQVLSHQAGLCGLPDEMPPETWLDWDAIVTRLAAMAPLWVPGSANGYHPQTFGFLVGEILRRVTGENVGQLLSAFNVSDGLQIFCGLRPDEMARVAYMPKPPAAPDLGELNEFTKLAFLKKWSATAKVAREDWMAAQIPASNMHADARSLATILHPLANNGRSHKNETILSPEAIAAFQVERISGDDLVLPFHLSWAAGMMRNINAHFGPNLAALGHAGFGGSCVVVDPDHNMTAAYVMSKMSPHLVGDPRAQRLLSSVYESL